MQNVDIYHAVAFDFKKDRLLAFKCKDKISSLLKEIDDSFTSKLMVEMAQTPFHYVYEVNNLLPPLPENKEIDLDEIMEDTIATYRYRRLNDWADALEKVKGKLKFLSTEKRALIIKEIKHGAIPVFMPGKGTLFSRSAIDLAGEMRFSYNDEGGLRLSDFPDQDGDYPIHDLTLNKVKSLYDDVPENPYILLSVPSQSPRKMDMPFFDYLNSPQTEMRKYNSAREKEKLAKIFEMKPHEFFALNYFYLKMTENLVSGRNIVQTPLDQHTYTVFPALPRFKNRVLSVGFRSGQFKFHAENIQTPSVVSGVRFCVRIQI